YRAAGGRMGSGDLAAVATAARRLGRDEPQLFKDALRVYDEAIAADSSNVAARVALGEMFLDRYSMREAASMLEGVLAVNPNHPAALVALARLRDVDGTPGASALVERALAAAPGYAPARAFRARLLFEVEDLAGAEAEAERALAAEPGMPDALAVLAAAHHLRLDEAGVTAAAARVTGGAPRRAEFHTGLAELVARNRLYADAVAFARRAVELDAASARAHAQLGVNLLRTGDVAAGRRALEVAFERDPYDVWTKNTLDLLDATAGYREIATPNFRIVVDARDADLLGPLAAELAEEAYARFAARYGWRPATPVRLELYTRHADFSVRTIGLAGLGALGVSFGPVVAMDSPAARDAGDFNWGSTLWHEVAHTFTLGASGYRVPRWLSEGLSVYEERRARPGWGMDPSPDFLAAYAAGRIPPPSRLNDGFMRPAYPAQVGHAYLAASLVCEYVDATHGADAFPRLLRAYRDGRTTEAALREVLGVSGAELDRAFDAWLRAHYARQLDAVRGGEPRTAASQAGTSRADSVSGPVVGGSFARALAAGTRALEEGNDDVALRELERARDLFPGASGPNGPHWLLARLHERRGDTRRAAAELAALTAVDEDDHAANLKLAELRLALGDSAGAAEALARTLWTSPYDASVHVRLAELSAGSGRARDAVRARRAVLALGPADEAEAHYRLALALRDAGDAAEARREVLRALEIAPAFEAAQTLLLELRGGAGGTR
ncbi:MAG TPA: tetratricopeptide repeat protein, partial [Gemmatimonadaceae bacterium]|nr:tetratricopeptide repeat protein [Gemmatimonadaceae bacterium]